MGDAAAPRGGAAVGGVRGGRDGVWGAGQGDGEDGGGGGVYRGEGGGGEGGGGE